MSLVRARAALALLVLGSSLVPPAVGAQPAPATAAMPSLYQRLGGYDAIAAVTDDFVGRLITDARLKRFFGGVSDNSKMRIRQLIVDQLCAVTGGPCVYIGRDMRTAHKGLGINDADWQAAVADLGQTLAKFKVGAAEQRDLAAALGSIKPDIVQSP